jgi:TatD DNase family protein
MEWQRQRFRVHIRAAQQVRKPLIIHTRTASDDTLAIMQQEGEAGPSAAGGVFHCFTETEQVARAALDMGYYISFSGIISFKTAQDLRDVVSFVPMDRLLIETDSPYLAPVPYRGKTNMPAYVPHVAAVVAQVKGIDVARVAEQTTANFHSLFPLTRS